MAGDDPVYEVGEEEQRRLERLLRRHRKRLLAYPNARDVDVGLEFADGRMTGRPAIRVHVTEKMAVDRLGAGERIPDELDGVPVDVIQNNPRPHAVPRNQRHDPLLAGVRVQNTMNPGGGTLGLIVFDRDSLEPYALSNRHVMARSPAVATDPIAQPRAGVPADVLGTVARSDAALDCAVCRLGGRAFLLEVYGLSAPAGAPTPARIGMKVVKSGLTTGITWGIIDGLRTDGFTVVPDTSVPAMGEMSLPGDSGSAWLELATNRAVGLHFAGEGPGDPGERASAKHLLSVLDKLNVMVFTGSAIGRAFIGSHCRVLARTRGGAPCVLRVTYPSGRRSSAKGLGAKTADANGWVEWSWRIGTHTRRKGAGTGAPFGIPLTADLTLDGVDARLTRVLEGTTLTT